MALGGQSAECGEEASLEKGLVVGIHRQVVCLQTVQDTEKGLKLLLVRVLHTHGMSGEQIRLRQRQGFVPLDSGNRFSTYVASLATLLLATLLSVQHLRKMSVGVAKICNISHIIVNYGSHMGDTFYLLFFRNFPTFAIACKQPT